MLSMSFAEEILSAFIGILIFVIGLFLLVSLIPSLYGGSLLGFIVPAAIVVLFIYVFIKKGLDL